MAGAQHVSTICLTYCLLSKGLWHSEIWIDSRSAGQVQSSCLLCAKTMAPRLQLRSLRQARRSSAAVHHPLVAARSHHGVWQEHSSWACLRHRWAGITIGGLGCRNSRPQYCYCSPLVLLAVMSFVLCCVPICKLVTVPQTPVHSLFHPTDNHHNLQLIFLVSVFQLWGFFLLFRYFAA